MLLSSSSPTRSSILDAIRRARRISKLSVGHDESGNPIDADLVSIQTIDSILRQKTRRITDIEIERTASKTFLLDEATGLLASSTPAVQDENLPGAHLSIESTKPPSSTNTHNPMSTASTTSESNPSTGACIPTSESSFAFVITDIEPISLKSSMKIISQKESLRTAYLSRSDRITRDQQVMIERDALYAELRELIPSTPRRPIRRGRRSHSRRQDTGEDTSEPADLAEERIELIKKQAQALHVLHPDAFFHRLRSTDTTKRAQAKRGIRFGNVQVRTYNTILGDHPVAAGPSLSLGWSCKNDIFLQLEDYESTKRLYREKEDETISPVALDAMERESLLRNIGYSLPQLLESELSKMIIQSQREETVANLKNENLKSVKSYIDDAKGNRSTSKVSKAA